MVAPLINFAGIASGIDSNALIDAISEQTRRARVTPLEDEITELEATNTSLTELKTKLKELSAYLREHFSSLAGGGLTKLAESSNESVVTASAGNSATNGVYTITPTQLAKNHTFVLRSTAGTYSSADAVIGSTIAGTGTVTVQIGTPTVVETVTVDVDNTTTLAQFADEFNSESTKAEASVINVGTDAAPDYRIIITSNSVGTAEGNIEVQVGAAISAANAFNNNSESEADDAEFTVTGITGTITRSTNDVGDLIPGVTFHLEAVGAATTITIGDDVTATTTKLQEFVDKYNEIVTLIAEQNLITREEDGEEVDSIFGPLAETTVDDNALSSIRSAITASLYSSGTNVRIFADFGITTERDGTLKFDSDILTTAIGKEPSSVNTVLQTFADTVSETGGIIDQFTRFSGLFDNVITGNDSRIDDLNQRISQTEESIAKMEDLNRQRFARLEGLIGRLQGQQGALTSALASLQR